MQTEIKRNLEQQNSYQTKQTLKNIIRDKQLKTISYTYTLLYQNFRVNANQKSTNETQTNKKNQLKYNTKDSHQTAIEENKRRREEKRATKTNPKQVIKWQ